MMDKWKQWLFVKLANENFSIARDLYGMKRFHCMMVVADTPYGIETFEYFNLKVFDFNYVPVNANEFISGIEVLLLETNSDEEIPKPLSEWIDLYHKERRDKLARVAGIDPQEFDAPTTTPNRPKM